MKEKKVPIELSFDDALPYIKDFFNSDNALINTFEALFSYMYKLDNDFIVRCNAQIIGIAKAKEFYRFYISQKADGYFIKFKQCSVDRLFAPGNITQYYVLCDECNCFFKENIDKLQIKEPDVTSQNPISNTGNNTNIWFSLHEKVKKSLETSDTVPNSNYVDEIYSKLINIIAEATFDTTVMDLQSGDIIRNRFLLDKPVTLAVLGEKYGVSRERVRQIAQKRWRLLTQKLRNPNTKNFISYQKNLQNCLLDIPDDMLICIIAKISERNDNVGSFLKQTAAPPSLRNDFQNALSEYAIAEKTDAKNNQCTNPKTIKSAEKIKDSVNIVEYISSRQELNISDNSILGKCPICGNPKSFVVYPKSKSFFCFSCGFGGDIFAYVMKTESLDFKSAVSKLKDIASISAPDDLMRDVALFYHSQLKTNAKAKDAIELLRAWGVNEKSTARLGIGYHDDSFNCLIDYMTSQKQYSFLQLKKANLIAISNKKKYYDKMRNSIIIPTINLNKKVICFDYYILDENRFWRYPNTSEFTRSDNLYSLNIAASTEKKSVIVVSSYKDYFKLLGLGISNVVSTYFPRISNNQLNILKKHFKVIMPFVPPYVDFSICNSYCKSNDMFCDNIDLQDCASPTEYLQKYGTQDIIKKTEQYEKLQ